MVSFAGSWMYPQDLQVANKKLRDEVEAAISASRKGQPKAFGLVVPKTWFCLKELENKITQIEKHEAERREQEERKHKEEADAVQSASVKNMALSQHFIWYFWNVDTTW